MPQLDAVLKAAWPGLAPSPAQAEAMAALVAGRDVLVVMRTGGGKSLCYQAASLARGGLGLVVSPLLALMDDQLRGLGARGVRAAAWSHRLSAPEKRRVLDALRARALDLLYLSPEALGPHGSPALRQALKEAPLALVAIDEAHCISQWGHDFRPDYLHLGEARLLLPPAPWAAFTATAPRAVRQDIVRALRLTEPVRLVGSGRRTNLRLVVAPRADDDRDLLAWVSARGEGAAIVYCPTQAEAERLAALLAGAGEPAWAYHAGLPASERQARMKAFLAHPTGVMAATVAFGMGVDRPDVRLVLHAGMPPAMGAYQQEAGRAGRDGAPATAVLLHAPRDAARWRRLIEQATEAEPALRAARLRALAQMRAYALGERCRHRAWCRALDEPDAPADCGSAPLCDRCEARSAPDLLAPLGAPIDRALWHALLALGATQDALADLVRLRPRTRAGLAGVKGLAPEWARRHADALLALVAGLGPGGGLRVPVGPREDGACPEDSPPSSTTSTAP